jgi:hypothetical protein
MGRCVVSSAHKRRVLRVIGVRSVRASAARSRPEGSRRERAARNAPSTVVFTSARTLACVADLATSCARSAATRHHFTVAKEARLLFYANLLLFRAETASGGAGRSGQKHVFGLMFAKRPTLSTTQWRTEPAGRGARSRQAEALQKRGSRSSGASISWPFSVVIRLATRYAVTTSCLARRRMVAL